MGIRPGRAVHSRRACVDPVGGTADDRPPPHRARPPARARSTLLPGLDGMNSRDAAQREPSYPRELFMRAVVQGIASCIDYDKVLRAAGPPGAQQISADRETGQ